jgi:single-strand DNA-binding protein
MEHKKGRKAMNKITIIGNLTKNPELRSTQDGTAVCGFTVAVNRPKTAKNPDPGADFFNVNAWRGLGENCAKFLEKGRKVAVVGRISLRTWEKEDKHGASLEVTAEDVEFLSSRNESPAAPSTPVGAERGMTVGEPADLPF